MDKQYTTEVVLEPLDSNYLDFKPFTAKYKWVEDNSNGGPTTVSVRENLREELRGSGVDVQSVGTIKEGK